MYAPGAYTGYGAKPIAAVREYMDEKKWKEADAEVPGVAKVIDDAAAAIGRRRTIWEQDGEFGLWSFVVGRSLLAKKN